MFYMYMNIELNYSMLYMYTNMDEVQPYFEKFDKSYWTSHEQPMYIEATGLHAWAQRCSMFSEMVPPTCNLSLHPFFFRNCNSSIT
jgi:hypothetical protein